MNHLKKLVSLLVIFPVLIQAQVNHAATRESDTGIQWTTGLSWQAIKEKAKKETKYIFLDLYATWCGPCKQMDKEVFSSDSVGSYINDKFLAVKVQMDKTKNDQEGIKSWYNDAAAMMKQYRVMAFPTYIFLAPDGRVVHKVQGFHGPNDFIALAATALRPGQVFVDKYAEYDRLEADYRSGIKQYDRMLYMIQMAGELRKAEQVKQLRKDYLSYLEGQKPEVVYAKENRDFLNTVSLKPDSKLFSLFYRKGEKYDKAFDSKGFAAMMVDKVIYREITVPLLDIKPKAVFLNGKTDSAEADWQGLHKAINKRFTKKYADRGLILARNTWYEQHYNYELFYKAYFDKLDLYGIDTVDSRNPTYYNAVNFHCYRVFKKSNNKELLNRAKKYMKQVVQLRPSNMMYCDTYASLLYKTGEKQQAITWEERAIALAQEKQNMKKFSFYRSVLAKMEAGQPIW